MGGTPGYAEAVADPKRGEHEAALRRRGIFDAESFSLTAVALYRGTYRTWESILHELMQQFKSGIVPANLLISL
jgi:hypothetical protein